MAVHFLHSYTISTQNIFICILLFTIVHSVMFTTIIPMSCSYPFGVLVSISCLYKLSLIDNTSMFVSSELSVSVVPDRPLNIILLTHYND